MGSLFNLDLRPTLKNHPHCKKKITQAAGKTFFFTLFNTFELNISCYFKCYLHHNYSINLNWNSTQLCSSAKPLCNVPSSVLWFVNFCLLRFLSRTSVQEENLVLLFTQVNRLDWNVRKDIKVPVSKSFHRGCSSDIASYYFRARKVTEHVTSRVSGGEFKTR